MAFYTKADLTAMVGKAYLLVSLSEQERLFGGMGDSFMAAALAYNAVGNEWEAEKWAMKAADEILVSDGPADRRVQIMKRLSEDPKSHWSWGGRVV